MMSEDGEMWAEIKKKASEKKLSNLKNSLNILMGADVMLHQFSEWHYLVEGEWNFWPTTGKFMHKKTGESGRGVFNLLKLIGNKELS